MLAASSTDLLFNRRTGVWLHQGSAFRVGSNDLTWLHIFTTLRTAVVTWCSPPMRIRFGWDISIDHNKIPLQRGAETHHMMNFMEPPVIHIYYPYCFSAVHQQSMAGCKKWENLPYNQSIHRRSHLSCCRSWQGMHYLKNGIKEPYCHRSRIQAMLL